MNNDRLKLDNHLIKTNWKSQLILPLISIILLMFSAISNANDISRNSILEKIWSPFFKRYTVDDGLSQSQVKFILQDEDEYIWLATPTGIDRFNGYEFESIPFKVSAERNPQQQISALILLKGQVTAITERGSIFVFNNQSKQFELIFSPPVNWYLKQVVSKESGEIYCFGSNGIYLLQLKDKEVSLIKNKKIGFEHIKNNHQVVIDKNGLFWIATTDAQLYSFNFDKNKLTEHFFQRNKQNNAQEPIFLSALASKGVIAAFVSGELFIVTEDKPPQSLPILDGVDTQPSNITGLLLSDKQYLFIATRNNGLFRVSLLDFSARQFKSQNSLLGSLSSNDIDHLFLDKQGLLWVSSPNGLNVAKVNNKRFFQIGGNYAYSEKLSSLYVSSILLDHSMRLWVGSHDAGFSQLLLINNLPQTAEKRKRTNKDDVIHYPTPVDIRSIARSNNDIIWVTSDKNISWFNEINGEPIEVSDEWQRVSQNGVETLSLSANGHLAINQLGKLTYEDNNGVFSNLQLPIQGTDLYDISGPYNHNYWITSANTGYIYQFNSIQKTITTEQLLTKHGTIVTSALASWMSASNELWIATYGDGIIKKDLSTNKLSWLDSETGLPDDYIYGLIGDKNGFLWITSNKGLTRIDIETNKIQNFTVKDGIQSNEFNHRATFKSDLGLLFFGGINGITVIDENNFSLNQHIPKTYIQEVSLLTKQGQKRLKVAQGVIEPLTYFSNSLTFKIGAIELLNPEGVRYFYRLVGQNTEWTDLGNHREITLLELSAGEFSLQVKSCNSEGSCNQVPVEVSFYIPPPPWFSWWAYIIYTFSLLTAAIYYISHQKNQLIHEKQQAEKEKKIANDLRELHELKDQFLTNTSHELRTPLNGIIGLSEMIELDPNNGYSVDSMESIKAINNCGHQLSTLVEDLLDFAQLQNKRLILKLEYFEINELIKHIVMLLQPQAKKRHLNIKAIYLRSPENVFADINRIRQVVYNLINNAIKFSNTGTINIILLKTAHLIKITVKDQGIGIDKQLHNKIFESFAQVDGSNKRINGGIGLGLAISKDIIELHGGELKVISELGKGTEFSFKLTTKAIQISD